jgi:hypothetical protein
MRKQTGNAIEETNGENGKKANEKLELCDINHTSKK